MQNRRKIMLSLFIIIIAIFGNYFFLMANNFSSKIAFKSEIINSYFYSKESLKVPLEADTSSFGNKIERIWSNNQVFNVKLAIYGFKDRQIRLSLVNLIGKEVKVIYEGLPKDSDWEYSFSYSEIPSGVYICVLSSSDYRDAKKIVISK
jgi:hypothetical protein